MHETRPLRSGLDQTEWPPGEEAGQPYEISEGRTLGRYVIGHRLGSGAMGVVYSATDPKLGRRVAIKLLHPWVGDGEHDAETLLEEARAMARLSHPNVITVHDVGTVNGQVFLAMEEVDGSTLTQWLATPRSVAQVLDTLIAAGRGLAAAHDRGLIHRDFKPDNVMVSKDARVLVTDFGVALDESDQASEARRAGALVGTPAYLAPEQFLGSKATARSDQFSYCVSVYEALYGQRPYAGRNSGAIFLSMANEDLHEPTGRSGVPGWLRKAVLRGLSKEPDARFETMHDLLGVLARGRRTRRWIPAIAVLGATGAVVAVLAPTDTHSEICSAGRQRLVGVWDAPRAATVATALTAGDSELGRETLERVNERLDRYTEAWVSMRDDSCRDTHLRGKQTEKVGDLRNACLDRRLHAVDSVVTLLEQADPDLVRNAVATVADLVPVASCADEASLQSKLAAPDKPQDVAQARKTLDQVDALIVAGRFEASVALATELQDTADEIGYAPLGVEVGLGRGDALAESGAQALAVEVLSSTYFAALQLNHDEVAASSASRLAYIVGYRQAQHAEGTQWGEHALAAARRLEDGGLAEADALHSLAVIAAAVGDVDAASEYSERAYALRRDLLDPDHPALARSLNALGNVHYGRGEYNEALDDYRAALLLRQRVFGPSHPDVARGLNNVAIALMARDEFALAADTLRRAVEIYVSAFGESHPNVAQATNNLGTALRRGGDPSAAVDQHQRSLEIRERTQGVEHPDTGDALVGLGRAYSDIGRHSEALEVHTRALAVYERGFGPDHPAVGSALLGRGIAQAGLGRNDDAANSLRRAATIFSRRPGTTEAAEVEVLLQQLEGTKPVTDE